MMAVLKWSAGAVLGLLVLGLGLYLGTRGDHAVPALVTADASRPSETVAGVALHLRRLPGPPDAPVIIVLHGGPGGDHRSLLPLEALSDRFGVVFYDQRGAGLSERVPEDRLTLGHHLQELRAVAERVSPEAPVILIGHSWGAMLATAYLGAHPGRVSRAVLIEPGYLDAAGRAAWANRASDYMSGLGYWREALLTGFRAQHVAGPDDDAAEDFLIGHMVSEFASHPGNPYHCGTGYGAPSWRFGAVSSGRWADAPDREVDQIAGGTAFAGPVLFLAGACNHWTGPSLQARHVARFPSAELDVIPVAGHDVLWDNPAVTLGVIGSFLARE